MSIKYAQVRKTDMLVTATYSSAQNPDPNEILEIETEFEFNKSYDYRYNSSDSTFYNVGPKPTVVNPEAQKVQNSPFASTDGFYFRGTGFSGTATKADIEGTPKETVIDWKIDNDRYVNGTHVMVNNATWGDNYDVEVVDKDFIHAAGAGGADLYAAEYAPGVPWSVATPNGVPLSKFIENWRIDPAHPLKPIKVDYPAKIYAGLYVRVTYRAHGATDNVDICMNAFLHEKVEE